MFPTLSREQKTRLNAMAEAGLEQSIASLGKMFDGRMILRAQPPQLRNTGIRVQLGLLGALEGEMYIELPEHMAVEIVKRLTAGTATSLLEETARSALMELGNIIASVFVAHFDRSRGLRTLPTPPQLSFVPRQIPDFVFCYAAELSWSQSPESAEILVAFQQPAIDILLA